MESAPPKMIYIVDDNALNRSMLEDYLVATGAYSVKVFGTGEECLEQLLSEKPFAVVLDYYLNAIHQDAANGLDILKKIKAQDESIHVIMLSEQESYGTALQTIQRGAENYVIKGENCFSEVANMLSELED